MMSTKSLYRPLPNANDNTAAGGAAVTTSRQVEFRDALETYMHSYRSGTSRRRPGLWPGSAGEFAAQGLAVFFRRIAG